MCFIFYNCSKTQNKKAKCKKCFSGVTHVKKFFGESLLLS